MARKTEKIQYPKNIAEKYFKPKIYPSIYYNENNVTEILVEIIYFILKSKLQIRKFKKLYIF